MVFIEIVEKLVSYMQKKYNVILKPLFQTNFKNELFYIY